MSVLHRVDETFEIAEDQPVVALRDLVFFPYMVLPLLIGRAPSVEALRAAESEEGTLLLLTQTDGDIDLPTPEDLHATGTVARILQVTPLTDGTSRVVLEGLARAEATRLRQVGEGYRSEIRLLEHSRAPELDAETEALVRQVRGLFHEYVALSPRVPDELHGTLQGVEDASRLGSLMGGHLLLPPAEKQAILSQVGIEPQFTQLRELVSRELEILRIEEKLDRQVQVQMDSDRRQFYLQEQLKAITKELGGSDSEWAGLEARIDEAGLPPAAREKAQRELGRLMKLNPAAPEASVIRTYLDWLADLPWDSRSDDILDVEHAARILDQEHHGLEEVKERILDHIAVLSLVGRLQGPILCLSGPPGVGKTSLGRSIAEALGREFVRVSLGGVRDEAEIRGHRRTYVGALPGRIIQGMRKSGSRNPVFLLDEVDKMSRDFHGDPGAALLEVLDPEQNKSFTDHYLELEFDLSDVLFVATANQLQEIPDPLRDRMEIIRVPGYLDTEKLEIGRRFLWPKQLERHGLDPDRVTIGDEVLSQVLDRYTREAGVRELDRRIARIARKLARRVASGEALETVDLDAEELTDVLGPAPYSRPTSEDMGDPRTGIANGLAWTAVGGEVLDVEVAVVPGTGQIKLTGTLGEVMKESAQAAMTYARARAADLGLDDGFHAQVDIHIHLPEGATPKDGPSAGITIAVGLISALTGIPSRADVAMTGEITLRGRVLKIGGLKEKAVAAHRYGVTTVLLPWENQPELERLPDEVKSAVRFLPVRTMDEVLEAALTHMPIPRDRTSTPGPLPGGLEAPPVQPFQ